MRGLRLAIMDLRFPKEYENTRQELNIRLLKFDSLVELKAEETKNQFNLDFEDAEMTKRRGEYEDIRSTCTEEDTGFIGIG